MNVENTVETITIKTVSFNEAQNKTTFFRDLQNEYLKHKYSKKSPFGGRVTLVEVSNNERFDDVEGLSIEAHWEVYNEVGEKVSELLFEGTNIETSELKKVLSNDLPVTRYIQSLFQLILSGSHATKDDVQDYYEAAGITR